TLLDEPLARTHPRRKFHTHGEDFVSLPRNTEQRHIPAPAGGPYPRPTGTLSAQNEHGARTLLSTRTLRSVLALLLLMPATLLAAPFAYITNYDDNTVTVIDTATNTATATIPVGINPFGVAVNPAGTRVYVGNNGDSTVTVIDTATN